MELKTYSDVERYLQNKQVYFGLDVVDSNMKSIASCGRVHDIGKVSIERMSKDSICFSFWIGSVEDRKEVILYENKTDKQFFEYIKKKFIPVKLLVANYRIKNNAYTY